MNMVCLLRSSRSFLILKKAVYSSSERRRVEKAPGLTLPIEYENKGIVR